MKARAGKELKTIDQISAGGAVIRKSGAAAEVVIVQIVPEMRWQLPKGIIDPGETPEIAAVREVREEAGVDAEIIEPVETISYWFTVDRDGEATRIHKSVHFFLMKFLGGDVADHDHEVAESRWVSVDEALRMLAFKSERGVVEKAAALLT